MKKQKQSARPKTFLGWMYINLREKTRLAFITGLVSVAASILTLIPFGNTAHNDEFLKTFSFTLIITSAVVVVATLITLFVLIIRRRSAQTSRLRKQVAEAFLKALDKSSFNPSHKVDSLDVRSSR
jgi:Na+/melibiose symporter-like transporter